jgi:hypothetical protein
MKDRNKIKENNPYKKPIVKEFYNIMQDNYNGYDVLEFIADNYCYMNDDDRCDIVQIIFETITEEKYENGELI